MRIAWIVSGIALINSMFWLFRLSAFRKDRQWERRDVMFAEPLRGLWNILDSSNYVPEARTVYRCYIISLVLLFPAALYVMFTSR